jgi:dipeptidyl aminopeptidase/acylaminoacyl peptidase
MRAISISFAAIAAATAVAQGDVLTPTDNLVVKGIPPIPRSIVEDVGRYTEFRAAVMSDWHPDRRELLVETRFGNTFQIHRVAMPMGARQQLTFFTEPASSASFPPRSHPGFFLFSKDFGGNEFAQIFRYDLEDGRTHLLTDGKSRNTMGPWSNDGRRIAYGSTRRNGRDVDIWIMNPEDPKSDRLLAELQGGGHWVLDWSPDDKQLLVIEYVSINESYLWLFDSETGAKTEITPRNQRNEPVSYGGGVFSRDGRSLFLTTDLDSEFRRLARYDLQSKRYEFLTEDIPWDVNDLAITEDRSRLAILTNENGISVLHLIDAQSGQRRKVDGIPVGVIGNISWHRNGRDLAFHISAARSATDVYSLDTQTNRLDRWTMSEAGGLNTETFSEPQLVSWKSFDGREITGFLYMPDPEKFPGPRPVIINIHGGPESQFRPTFLGRNNYYLNEMGVAVLFPNVRGSSGYGKTFLKLDNAEKRFDSYRDIETLLDWIATQPNLRADRVMATGASYGGHMTFAVATFFPDRIAAALPIVGMSNLVTFLENTEDYRRDLRRVEYGDERDPKMREYLLSIAPLNHAEKIRAPMFIVQGANDPRVPLSEAEQMVATMERIGTPVWYLMAKDEGHGFAKKGNQDFQFYATVMFIREHLLRD